MPWWSLSQRGTSFIYWRVHRLTPRGKCRKAPEQHRLFCLPGDVEMQIAANLSHLVLRRGALLTIEVA